MSKAFGGFMKRLDKVGRQLDQAFTVNGQKLSGLKSNDPEKREAAENAFGVTVLKETLDQTSRNLDDTVGNSSHLDSSISEKRETAGERFGLKVESEPNKLGQSVIVVENPPQVTTDAKEIQ